MKGGLSCTSGRFLLPLETLETTIQLPGQMVIAPPGVPHQGYGHVCIFRCFTKLHAKLTIFFVQGGVSLAVNATVSPVAFVEVYHSVLAIRKTGLRNAKTRDEVREMFSLITGATLHMPGLLLMWVSHFYLSQPSLPYIISQ